MNLPFADSLLEAWVRTRVRAANPHDSLQSLQLASLERVLLVLTTGLGDAVLSTPVFPALRRALPRARIGLFVRSAWAELFEADPDLDCVIPYPGKYRRFVRTLQALRDFRAQLTLVLHGNDPDILPMLYLAGSRNIVRIPTAGTRFRYLLANADRAEDAATIPGWHYIENRLRILDAVGIAPVTRTPRIHLGAKAGDSARAFADSPYWVYHAFSAGADKTWPAESSRSFLERTQAALPSYRIVLTGAPRERNMLEHLARGLARTIVLAGRATLRETAAVLSQAACVVAPDTGMLHLAAALDRPVVGLYGPTSASLVGPRAANARVVVIQAENTMSRIELDEVLKALTSQLLPMPRP
ncbi:MAG TPA: glycosyltransferase family 9 protein [Burkholderiales bacterium]